MYFLQATNEGWPSTPWTAEHWSNIIAFLGMLAAFWALFLTIKQNWKNKTKVDQLANIVDKLADQNKTLINHQKSFQEQNAILIEHQGVFQEQNELIVKQIEGLSEQNKLQALQMKFQVAPDLKVEVKPGAFMHNREIRLNCSNIGERCIVTQLEFKSNDLTLEDKQVPIALGKNGAMTIILTAADRDKIWDAAWAIYIHYNDIFGNPYLHFVSAKGNNIRKQGSDEFKDSIPKSTVTEPETENPG